MRTRSSWIWCWVIGAVLASGAGAQQYATIIDNLPTCTGNRNGRVISVSDAVSDTDCTVGGATGTDRFVHQCICDTLNALGPYWKAVGGTGGGGGEATSVQGSATLPATCTEKDLYQDTNSGGTEFYVCTATNTWTKAGTGDGTIGGTLTATDDLAVCTDGTGGSTVGACTVLNIDNIQADANTISTTNSNGSLVLAPNGTGTVTVPAGSESIPSVKFSTDLDTGIYSVGLDGSIGFVTNGSTNAFFRAEGFRTNNATYINGFSVLVEANTAGSGAPNVLASNELMTVLTNEGATAENYHTLPTAVAGYTFTFVVQDADGMRITAAAGDTIRPIAGTAASATAGFIRCATQGAFITLVAINSTEWVAIGSAGTWTIDV